MLYTLTFSHIVDGKRTPFLLEGREASIQVEAADKTSAIFHQDTFDFCHKHTVSVRSVT